MLKILTPKVVLKLFFITNIPTLSEVHTRLNELFFAKNILRLIACIPFIHKIIVIYCFKQS